MAQLLCFDELKEMAERDPEGFENYRKLMCNQFIDSIPAPHRPRLRAVQFRVNTVIHRAKTPLAGLLKVSGMMHDSLQTLSVHLHDLHEFPYTDLRPRSESPLADVVDLSVWRHRRQRRTH